MLGADVLVMPDPSGSVGAGAGRCGLDRRGRPGPQLRRRAARGTRAGLDNEFTERNTTVMTWSVLRLAPLLKDAGGFRHGDQREEWDAAARFDYVNPEHRS